MSRNGNEFQRDSVDADADGSALLFHSAKQFTFLDELMFTSVASFWWQCKCQGILFSGLRWTSLVVYHCVYYGVL